MICRILTVLTLPLWLVAPATAQQIRLDAIEGTASISGELVDFDGVTFRVSTPVGVFSVKASTVVCTGPGCPKFDSLPSVFTISAPPQLAEFLMADIISNYGEDQGGDVFQNIGAQNRSDFSIVGSNGEEQAQIALVARNSTDAIADLLQGNTAIAVSDRRVTQDEEDAFQQGGKGAFSASNEQTLALDGLVALVSPGNPVSVIDTAALAQVLSGEIRNWGQLGGANAPINVLVPPQGSSALDNLTAQILEPNGLQLAADVQVVEDDFISDQVLNDPNSIGIGRFSNLRNARALSIAGVCGLPIEASVFTIKSGEYPLAQPLYMYFARQTLPLHARQLLEYTRDDFVQSMVLDAGLVDKTVSGKSIDAHGQHLISAITDVRDTDTLVAVQRLFGNLSEAERLSAMFWFEPNEVRSDLEMAALAESLVSYFDGIDMTNREIQVIGFSDRLEETTVSTDLSRERAEEVRELLTRAGEDAPWLSNVRTFGYGSIAPLGCNEDDSGRRLNRRVEIWLRSAR